MTSFLDALPSMIEVARAQPLRHEIFGSFRVRPSWFKTCRGLASSLVSKLNHEEAVKIPLSSLGGEKMQNLRSALNRVTREKKIPVVTSSDDKYLYVWCADTSKNAGTNE